MTKLTLKEQGAILTGILADFAEDDADNLGDYLAHAEFDISAISDPKELLPAWLGHYRIRKGVYDLDRAILHLATWPPIASRIVKMQAGRQSLSK